MFGAKNANKVYSIPNSIGDHLSSNKHEDHNSISLTPKQTKYKVPSLTEENKEDFTEVKNKLKNVNSLKQFVNAVSKINSGMKPPRKLGEPIKELSTLKRQRTPPIKSEREAEKLRKLKLKTSS